MTEEIEGLHELMQEIWIYSRPMIWIGGDNERFIYCSSREWLEGVHEFVL